MQTPDSTTHFSQMTPEQVAIELQKHGAKQLPDGTGLIIRDAGKAHLPPGWNNAPLCLQPCQVASGEVHPGLHILPKGASLDKAVPVCAGPKGHPGSCMCFPGDKNRYGTCPDCKALVAKRAIQAHIDAHKGINRTDKTTLKHAAQNDLADAILLWVEKNGGFPDLSWAVEQKIRLGGWNVSGQWCKGWLKNMAAQAEKEGWLVGFPTGLREARALLTANGRTLYADGRPSAAARVEEAKALAATLRERITQARQVTAKDRRIPPSGWTRSATTRQVEQDDRPVRDGRVVQPIPRPPVA
jgi:hypothetical protein